MQRAKRHIALLLIIIFIIPFTVQALHIATIHHIHMPLVSSDEPLMTGFTDFGHCPICEYVYAVFENNPDFFLTRFEIQQEYCFILFSQNIPYGFSGAKTELRGPPFM